jgi:toxin ParE1/3/4
MRELRFKAAAQDDLADAVQWYERETPGAGYRMRSQVFKALQLALAFPGMYPEIRPGVRRLVLSRFPYCIYYRVTAERVTVQAVLHTSRSPETHASRLDDGE